MEEVTFRASGFNSLLRIKSKVWVPSGEEWSSLQVRSGLHYRKKMTVLTIENIWFYREDT